MINAVEIFVVMLNPVWIIGIFMALAYWTMGE